MLNRTLHVRFAVIVLLILLLSGCAAPAPACDDPLGCVHFQPGETIKIGVSAPVSAENLCPSYPAALQALDTAFGKKQTVLGQPVELTVTNSRGSIDSARDNLTALSMDPATIALFSLDCTAETRPAALVGSNAGLPTWVTSLNPVAEPISGVYSWLPAWPEFGQQIYALLAPLDFISILVLHSPLERAAALAAEVCSQADAAVRCSTLLTETGLSGLEDQSGILEQTDLVLYLDAHPQADSSLVESWLAEGKQLIFFDPYLLPVDPTSLVEGVYLIGPQTWDTLNRSKTSAVWEGEAAAISAQTLRTAVERVAVKEADGSLTIPRASLLQVLSDPKLAPSQPPLSWICNSDQVCLNLTLSLYRFQGGNLIINY